MRYSKEECIKALVNLAEEYPEKSITRDFFRKNSEVPVSNWTYHFGTFSEFKRQAGEDESRSEKKFLNELAFTESADQLRKHNDDKQGWDQSYLKPTGKRIQTFLVGSDFHDIMCDPFFRRMFIEAARAYGPDQIIFNGDLYDMIEFSRYNSRPTDYAPLIRMQWVRDLMNNLRNTVPDAEFHLVEGNHEYRLVKHLTEKAPAVMDILNLQGMGVKEFLGLHEFNINYHSRADFATFNNSDINNQLKRNYYNYKDIVLFHHYPIGMSFGMPGISGHHHKYKVWDQFNITYGSYNWHQLGGGSRRHVEYMETMGEKWNNGFMIIHVDTENKKNTIFNYIDCTNQFAVIAGTMFERNPEEMVFLT